MVSISGELRYWLQMLAFAAVAFAAWRWGRGPERALAAVLIGMALFDGINHTVLSAPNGMLSVAAGHFIMDAGGALAAIGIALFANRVYALWFAAFQFIALLAHLAHGVTHGIAQLAYMMMYTGPSYFQILLLAGGIWFHHRRERRFGPYRAWRSFSRRSPETMPRSWPNG